MLFVSGMECGLTEVTDTDTEKTVRYTDAEIQKLLSEGVQIKGISNGKISVYASVQDMRNRLRLRLALTGKMLPDNCEPTLNGKVRWVRYSVDSNTVLQMMTETYATVTQIGESCFANLEDLKTLTLGYTAIEEIQSRAFYNCQDLVSISLPPTLKVLGESCFECCSSLETISIPEGVVGLPERCFAHCDALRYISIPESVTEIDSMCFSTFEGLTVCVKDCSYAHQWCKRNRVRFVIKQ